MPNETLEKLVTELDVLIRARYPLIAANTHEEGRFKRVMTAVANLKCHKEKDKGLYIWSRTNGDQANCRLIKKKLKSYPTLAMIDNTVIFEL